MGNISSSRRQNVQLISNQGSPSSPASTVSDQILSPSPSPSSSNRSKSEETSSSFSNGVGGSGSSPLLSRLAPRIESNYDIPSEGISQSRNEETIPHNDPNWRQIQNQQRLNSIVFQCLPIPINPIQSHPCVTIHDNTKNISVMLFLIRLSYFSVLIVKLFLKFYLVPYLFFAKKPYGDISNVSMETITIFLWLILIYMTIFVVIAIIGIIDENFFLILCFLLLMDLEIIVCLYNNYIDTNSSFTIIISGIVLSFTFLYLLLICFESTLKSFLNHRRASDLTDITVMRPRIYV